MGALDEVMRLINETTITCGEPPSVLELDPIFYDQALAEMKKFCVYKDAKTNVRPLRPTINHPWGCTQLVRRKKPFSQRMDDFFPDGA